MGTPPTSSSDPKCLGTAVRPRCGGYDPKTSPVVPGLGGRLDSSDVSSDSLGTSFLYHLFSRTPGEGAGETGRTRKTRNRKGKDCTLSTGNWAKGVLRRLSQSLLRRTPDRSGTLSTRSVLQGTTYFSVYDNPAEGPTPPDWGTSSRPVETGILNKGERGVPLGR